MMTNAWGEEIDESKVSAFYKVSEVERLDTDEGLAANALGVDSDGLDTGDDLDGWQPGDPAEVEEE